MVAVKSPYSGELVGDVERASAAHVEAELQHAVQAQKEWREQSVHDRCLAVREVLGYFEREREAVAGEVTRQMGKPITEARSELECLFERAEYLLEVAEEVLSPEELPAKLDLTRRIEHVPLGVVFNIAAWNYPLIIPINVIVPALLAGNSVLLKHSTRTLLTGERFEQAFASLGPGLVQHLVLSHAQTEKLIGDRRIAHVAFTGSVEGGRQIQAATSRRFVDAGLELGGKDPAYVAADADLEFAAANVVEGACYNAGQSCCAIERVYVESSVLDEFLVLAQRFLADYRGGDPLDDATTLGPLADSDALSFLEGQVEDAVSRGARLLAGGESAEGRFFQPTLLAGCPNDSEVMQEESFGPLVSVLGVSGDDEALSHMNDTRFGLTASVWTQDRERAEWFARRLEAGTVFQNRCDYLDPALPWTGYGDSGKGSTLSRYGFFHLTRRKSIHFRERSGS